MKSDDIKSALHDTLPVLAGYMVLGIGFGMIMNAAGYGFKWSLAMIIEPGHYLRQLTHLSVTFGVYNVTGRKNAYSIYYTNNQN